jgi:PPOX class probable F420-dependent enzyme
MVTIERKMTQGEIEEFLSKPNLARIGTLNPDGSPHVTPIWFLLGDGCVTFTTGKNTRKASNLSRDNRVCLCVDERDPPNRSVVLNGNAVSLGDMTKEYLQEISIHYLGEERGREYSEEMEVPSTIYRIQLTRVISWYYATL